MGESKRRGPREARVAEAVAQRNSRLDEIKQRLGIPQEAEFLGYLIRVGEGEFIQAIEDTEAIVKRAFIATPEEAMRFGRYLDANRYLRPGKGDRVVGLFAVQDRYEVVDVI